MSEKKETECFFFFFLSPNPPTLSPPCSQAGEAPGESLRLIGSFGLEKWIPPHPEKKTCFLPKQMTNELIDLLFTIRGAQCPPSAHDGLHNGRVSEVYRRRSPTNRQLSRPQNAHNCRVLLLCQALRRSSLLHVK